MRTTNSAVVMAAIVLALSPAKANFGSNMVAALPDTLGQVIGNMAANRVDLEKLCQEGKPLPEPYQKYAVTSANELMANYFKAVTSKRSRLGSQLRDKDEGAHWIGPQGEVDLDALSDPYLSNPTHSAPELKQIVPAGDILTIRTIWSFTIQKPDDPMATQRIEYGVDILHSYWRGYKIWHVHVYVEPDTAPVPTPYCRFDPASSY